MVELVGFFTVILCFAVINDYPKGERIKNNKWMYLVPIIAVFAVIYSILNVYITVVPQDGYLTKPVRVERSDGEAFIWNLVVDADDSSYQVSGYISPIDGKIIDVKSGELKAFGKESAFTEKNTEFKTVVSRQDIEVSVIERIKSLNLIIYIAIMAGLIISAYSLVIDIRLFRKLRADNYN